MRALALPLLLAACATAAPAPQPPAPAPLAERIAAECRLLEAAQADTIARGLQAWPVVLTGCPGHEGAAPAMTMAQASDATRRANSATLPPAVATAGPRAETVYRRMITRGVPVEVAEAMALTPGFAAALR